jgi:hypothetical protein
VALLGQLLKAEPVMKLYNVGKASLEGGRVTGLPGIPCLVEDEPNASTPSRRQLDGLSDYVSTTSL